VRLITASRAKGDPFSPSQQNLSSCGKNVQRATDNLVVQAGKYAEVTETNHEDVNIESLGAVARNKAVQELAQLRGQDPLPLRKAKITQEAAVRKVEAERKRAEAARMPFTVKRQEAEEVRRAAEAARRAAEDQTRKVEAAIKDTEAKAQAAQEYLEEIKRQCSTLPHGQIWWMERQVKEAKKYMPRSRQ